MGIKYGVLKRILELEREFSQNGLGEFGNPKIIEYHHLLDSLPTIITPDNLLEYHQVVAGKIEEAEREAEEYKAEKDAFAEQKTEEQRSSLKEGVFKALKDALPPKTLREIRQDVEKVFERDERVDYTE